MFHEPIISMNARQMLSKKVVFDDLEIKLSGFQHTIVMMLLAAPPEIYVRLEDMIEALYPYPNEEADYAESVIFVQISRLRKLGFPIESNRYCTKVFGHYRFALWARGLAPIPETF